MFIVFILLLNTLGAIGSDKEVAAKRLLYAQIKGKEYFETIALGCTIHQKPSITQHYLGIILEDCQKKDVEAPIVKFYALHQASEQAHNNLYSCNYRRLATEIAHTLKLALVDSTTGMITLKIAG